MADERLDPPPMLTGKKGFASIFPEGMEWSLGSREEPDFRCEETRDWGITQQFYFSDG